MRTTEKHRPRESNKEEKRKSSIFFSFLSEKAQQTTYKGCFKKVSEEVEVRLSLGGPWLDFGQGLGKRIFGFGGIIIHLQTGPESFGHVEES